MRVAQACLDSISPYQFWFIADLYPDFGLPILVVNFCLLCKESVEDVGHFLLNCPNFRDDRQSLWSNLSQKVIACNPSDVTQVSPFFSSLDREQKILLLLVPFDQVTVTVVKRLISSALGKLQLINYTCCGKKCFVNWSFPIKYICNFLFYLTNFYITSFCMLHMLLFLIIFFLLYCKLARARNV